MTNWTNKLDAYLHDPPEKVLDLAWHKARAEAHAAGQEIDDAEFYRPCDHHAAAADRLPWPHWRFLESKFDGHENHFRHPLGKAVFLIEPYRSADVAHGRAWKERPSLSHGDERARFFAFWRFWRWWASDQRDSRLAFLPADTRLPDHTIWTHNSVVSALQGCVHDGWFRPAFLLFHIGPVQEYIAQARRTLDLWSGSYLVSYLIGAGLRHIALNYGPDNIIFPNLCGQPIFDLLLKEEIWDRAGTSEFKTLWECFGYERTKDGQPNDYGRRRLLTPSLPNRFLALVPGGNDASEGTKIGLAVEKAIRSQFKAIAEQVWSWAANNLKVERAWTPEVRSRFDRQCDRFLDISWQVVPWPDSPGGAFDLTSVLPEAARYEQDQGPRAGLWTILEMARRTPKAPQDHRDVRNFECDRFPAGHAKANWKDKSKLRDEAMLENVGAAWSALYQLAGWQLDAVRQTRAWQAWSDGGWAVGRDRNKDSLNGKEEAILIVGTTEGEAKNLNEAAQVAHLFKPGELLGASTLVKRLWHRAWLQRPEIHGVGDNNQPLFKPSDFFMPDTRSIAASRPFDHTEEARDVEASSEETSEPKYFAVLALDGDEIGKWVSGLHGDMPRLDDQLSPGAREYFQKHLGGLLDRKRPLSPSFHLQFSEMLANFANFCARRIVEAFDGRLIYSGGDDVLALLPATTALACAGALRGAFRANPAVLNRLTGARQQGNKPLRLFDFEQEGFVRLHRDALALQGEPKKFHAMVPGPAADCSVGIAIAHFKAPLQDVVRAAQAAEKRAKKQLGRSAVAVTLMKRSGETIEWGAKWQSGGLEIFEAILKAMQAGAVSSKFPHRVVGLLEGYLTETTPLAAKRLEPLKDFPVVEVVLCEFRHALDRQGQDKKSREYARLLEIGGRSSEASGPLHDYLARSKQDAETQLRKARSDQSEWSRLTAQEKRRLENRPPEAAIRALIGLCQTVAFIERSLVPGQSATPTPQSVIEPPAERQPVAP